MAEVKEVTVPDIGDFSEVPVIEILVAPGDTVAQDDPLVTLESDKATMDIPAPAAGVVKELLVKIGDTVSQGTALLTIEGEANGASPAAPKPEAGEKSDSDDEAASSTPVETAVEAEAQDAAPDEEPPSLPEPEPQPQAEHERAGVHAGPGVRRLARELDVDLAAVKGSGPKGRVTKDDLKAHLAGAAAPAGGATLPPWPQVDFEKFGPVERTPLSRIKRIGGANLARNWVTIPHVTQHEEADVTDLEAFRKELNAEQDLKVTMTALLLKASVASLKAFPEFNASLDGDELVLKRYYHLGFAADTPRGLVVPVIRDVDGKGLLEVAAELADLSARAREGKLGPGDMEGGTFTISSLGGIGGTAFTPIVNAPEVAILGVSRSGHRPVWDGSEFRPRLVLPLSLSYDHRVIDGAAAARFCAHLAGVLSDLRRVLL